MSCSWPSALSPQVWGLSMRNLETWDVGSRRMKPYRESAGQSGGRSEQKDRQTRKHLVSTAHMVCVYSEVPHCL